MSYRISPEILSGITLRSWMRVLRDNRFQVDPPYLGRAAVTTLLAFRNSAAAYVEQFRFGRNVAAQELQSPIFILGAFRSGTTFLQNLFAQDPRFAYPSLYETIFPLTFLTLEPLDAIVLRLLLPRTRAQDNVPLGLTTPHEDEFALCNSIGRSFVFDVLFPRRSEFYRRYYSLEQLTDEERAEWQQAWVNFLKKLTLKHNKRLVLKSPGHTCRVAVLLKLFPDARFVYIHRNPVHVFQSWKHLIESVSPKWRFQRDDLRGLEDDIVRYYQVLVGGYLQQRHCIPANRLHEVAYEQLVAAPYETMQQTYGALQLPDFEVLAAPLSKYLDHSSSYQPTIHAPLSRVTLERLASNWQPYFDQWGYSVEVEG